MLTADPFHKVYHIESAVAIGFLMAVTRLEPRKWQYILTPAILVIHIS
jgi:hypothetical protein